MGAASVPGEGLAGGAAVSRRDDGGTRGRLSALLGREEAVREDEAIPRRAVLPFHHRDALAPERLA